MDIGLKRRTVSTVIPTIKIYPLICCYTFHNFKCHNYQMLLWKYEQTNMHSQTCPSITKSVIEAILRKRNAKIRSKPETKIWNLMRFGIRNLLGQNPESTAQNPESNIVLDYLTWDERSSWPLIRMSRNALPLRPPHAPPVLTSFVIYY